MSDGESNSHAPRNGALLVGAGILFSRLIGLVRERVFAHYFGNSALADAFKAALRIPNVLQNLFGEGVLSGSFIPVYAGLLAAKEKEEARETACAVFTCLALLVAVIVALGVAFSPQLVDLIAPGFAAEKRDITVMLTRIFFPGVGLLVLSAWCLGVLNSHHRFFLSYSAPVVWNAVIIATMVWFGSTSEGERFAVLVAWGVVAGSALQFLIQLPSVLKLLGKFRLSFRFTEPVKVVLRNFVPVILGRGVVQISAYADSLIASLLSNGAVAALSYSQTVYLLPVGLFGMSVSASELPAMSKTLHGGEEVNAALRGRLERGLRQIAVFVVPSAFAFFFLGDVLVAGVYQTGRFGESDTQYVWHVLAAMSLGLTSATLARLYASTFYALKDTRIPLNCSLARVAVSVALGCAGALLLPHRLGMPQSSGLVFLALASSIGAVFEFFLLRNLLSKRIGAIPSGAGFLLRLALAAGVCSVLCRTLLPGLDGIHPLLKAFVITGVFGGLYLGICTGMKIPEARSIFRRFARR